MKVVARTNRGQGLPESEQREFGSPVHTVHPITSGQEYGVYAMMLTAPFEGLESWSFGLHFLILQDHGRPGMVPAPLFDVSDSRLSANWQFLRKAPSPDTRVRALWGYESAIKDEYHLSSLSEIEKLAQRIFLAEIDRSCMAGRDEEHLSALARSLG